MGVIVKEALANGRLTSHNAATPFTAEGGRLHSEAERLGVGTNPLASAAALARP